MDFVVVALGASHVAYVRQELAAHAEGGRLLGSILAKLDLEQGHGWAIVPAERAAAALADLDGAPIQTDTERNALIQATVPHLWARLQESPPRVLAFEHWTSFVVLNDTPTHAFAVGDSAFDYVTKSDSVEEVARLLQAALWHPTVGIIAPIPPAVDLYGARLLSAVQLEELASHPDLILIGAWGAEGYIFWSPSQGATA